MSRYSQRTGGYVAGPAGPGSLIARVIAFIVGLGAFIVSLFVGAVFLAAVFGFVLIVGTAVALRLWWLRRKFERELRENADLDAEYTVITEERRRF